MSIKIWIYDQTIRSKTVINNQKIEQLRTFNYLDCDVSYNGDKDLQKKFKFQQSYGE